MDASGMTRHGRLSSLGLASAAGGASLWGLSFVVPLFMPGVTAWDVSLGRYLVFGFFGTLFVLRARSNGFSLTGRQWITAFLFGATGYYGCYTALVYAIDLAGPALPTLVMGLTPVCVAVVANLRSRDIPFVRLLPPLCLLGAGLVLVNIARHGQGLSLEHMGWGMFASVLALALLTYYLVANIIFLKENPRISPLTWASATGCSLMVFSVVALAARLLFTPDGLPWEGTPTTVWGYVTGSLVLGVGVSWLGGTLWNKANAMLPPAVAGQCIVFWPVSGIVYASILKRELPGVWETLGMGMVFAGGAWGLKAAQTRRNTQAPR